jgi:diguanylate cyclase (GGDEF)-like protein
MSEYVRDLRRRDRLGSRLMATTVLLACLIGLALSIAQILADSRAQSAEIDRVVQRLMSMMREPATEAAYNIDDRLARRVLDGVFRFDGIVGAELVVGRDEVLATETRAPVESHFRFVTAALFGDVREYQIPLVAEKGEEVGRLRLQLDTYPPGRAFLLRAALVLLLGMVNAALLAFVLLYVFNRFLTRPLVKMAHQLTSFDPNAPEAIHVEVPEAHEKDELGLWARAVNRLLGAIRDNQARRTEAETRASWLEHFDTLTGLANRSLLLANTTHAIAGADPELRLALVIVDIREFRDVNAQFGAEIGDQALCEVAHRLNYIGSGGSSLLARLAEDAFAFLMSGPDVRERAESLSKKLQLAFEAPLMLGANKLALGVDIGIAVYPDDADNADQLIQNAERALAYAKKVQLGEGQGAFRVLDQQVGAVRVVRIHRDADVQAEQKLVRVDDQRRLEGRVQFPRQRFGAQAHALAGEQEGEGVLGQARRQRGAAGADEVEPAGHFAQGLVARLRAELRVDVAELAHVQDQDRQVQIGSGGVDRVRGVGQQQRAVRQAGEGVEVLQPGGARFRLGAPLQVLADGGEQAVDRARQQTELVLDVRGRHLHQRRLRRVRIEGGELVDHAHQRPREEAVEHGQQHGGEQGGIEHAQAQHQRRALQEGASGGIGVELQLQRADGFAVLGLQRDVVVAAVAEQRRGDEAERTFDGLARRMRQDLVLADDQCRADHAFEAEHAVEYPTGQSVVDVVGGFGGRLAHHRQQASDAAIDLSAL